MNSQLSPIIRVSIFVLTTVGIIAGMSLRVNNDPSWRGSAKHAWFYADDVSGLASSSNVSMGGLKIGVIKNIRLEKNRAKVELVLEKDVPLTSSVRIEIRPDGVLGDKHVEVVPGNPFDPPFKDGGQIVKVEDRASVDRLIAEVSNISKALTAIAENLKQSLRADRRQPLGRILSSLDQLTSDLKWITHGHRQEIGQIVDDLHDMIHTLKGIISKKGPDGLIASLKAALKSLTTVEASIQNIEQITGKIKHGDGTIGRLVNDETTVDEVKETVSTLNAYLDEVTKMETLFDFNSQYLASDGSSKTTLDLTIQPGMDRYYELGVVYNPYGVTETDLFHTNAPSVNPNIKTKTTFFNSLRFNALFAKNFGALTLKAGLIESFGGGAIAYSFHQRKYCFMLEVFNFPNTDVRFTARANIWSGFYAFAGGEDLFNRTNHIGSFVGLGFTVSTEDLKLLLASASYQNIPNTHQ